MATETNREWQIAEYPTGLPTAATFNLVDVDMPEAKEGELVVKAKFISCDPYMRGRLTAPGPAKRYIPSFELNKAGAGGMVGEVVTSNSEGFAVGDLISFSGEWREYQVLNPSAPSAFGVHKVPAVVAHKPSVMLGALGLTGLSAYLPIKHIGEPKEGEVAYVSGAAGAVGSAACQILQSVYKCRVVGSAGSDEKVAHLKELGVEAFNYKTTAPKDALPTLAPEGLDIYFDNVGGATLDAALENMKGHGRIIACGAISQYNATADERYGVKNTFMIIGKSLKMQGFIVTQWASEFGETVPKLAELVATGKLNTQETVFEGFEKLPEAFIGLFEGKNTGKAIVSV